MDSLLRVLLRVLILLKTESCFSSLSEISGALDNTASETEWWNITLVGKNVLRDWMKMWYDLSTEGPWHLSSYRSPGSSRMSEQLQGNVMLASGFHSFLHNGQVSLVHMLFPGSLSTVLWGIVSSTFGLVERMLSGRTCVVDMGSSLSSRSLPKARESKVGKMIDSLRSFINKSPVCQHMWDNTWGIL